MSGRLQAALLGLLPRIVRERLAGSPDLRGAIASLNWLLAAQLVEMSVALVAGAMVARYLGPTSYGTVNFVFALYALFDVFGNPGVFQIGMRELVAGTHPPAAVLGTSLGLRCGAALTAMLCFLGVLALLHPAEGTLLGLGAILAVGSLLATPDTLGLWFQARVQSKYVVLARSGSRLGFVLVKLGLIAAGSSLVAFVVALAGELAVGALVVAWLFVRRANVSLRSLRWDRRLAGHLFAEGWPLTLTAFTLVLYARIDQLMLGSMLGERQVGIYTAATRLSEGLYVVPSLLLASVLPALIGLRRDKPEVYRARLQLLYDALVWGAFGAALLLTLCAGPLIELLFGEAYRASVRVLQVHAWGLLFVFPGTATHRYLMVEGQTRVSLIMSVAGAALNLAANFYLIPLHGVLGAAWATLLSLAAGHVAVAAAFAGPRSALGLFAASLHPVRVARRWHALLRNRI